MSDQVPVRLAVLQSIQAALQGMAIVDGYYFDVEESAVTLDRRPLHKAMQLPAFVVEPGAGGSRDFLPAMRMKDTFPVIIYGRADATGISDTSRRLTIFEQLGADLERALTQDITRGGIAIDTRLRQPNEPYVEMDPINSVYIEQPVDVILRRVYGAPEGS